MTLSSNETLACLIIDDPLLTPSYGCLNYEALLAVDAAHVPPGMDDQLLLNEPQVGPTDVFFQRFEHISRGT